MPIKKRPCRLPYVHKKLVREQISEILQKDIIEPSHSPWSAPIVMVLKKRPVDAGPDYQPSWRLCVDFRMLN